MREFITALLFVGSFCLQSQELPPINVFSPKDYGAESQNWAISQSKDKSIYVANNKGLLEFNGATWRLYDSPNETIFRSVKVFEDKIFTGFYMDFGYWTRNNFGSLEYTSICKKLKIPVLEDEQFWNIVELDGWMLFQSLERIYLYNLKTKEYKIITSESQIVKMMKVNETIYFQKQGVGVFKIEKGIPILVSNNSILKENNLVNIYLKDKKLLFLTQDLGFYVLEDSNFYQWKIPGNKEVLNESVYSSIQLKNGDYILGTISDGFVYLSKKGETKYHITQHNGLSNNTVLSLFEDEDNNIWLGLDNGIDNINMNSPFKIYTNTSGFLGTIYCSIINKGNLYLGTNQGLFYKKVDSNDAYTFIENTQGQVWNLLEIDGDLLCGHNIGTFLIDDNKATKIIDELGTWDIKPLGKNLYLQGNYNGLHILEKKNNKWLYKNKLEGFNISSRFFEVLDKNNVFVSHEYKGVFRLKIDNDLTKVEKVENESSIEKGIYSSLINYQNRIIYANQKGVFGFDKEQDFFVKDSILSSLYTKESYVSGKLIYSKASNLLWGFSDKNIHYISTGKISNVPTINTIPISNNLRKGATSYENVSLLKDQNYLLGTSNGYIILNLDNVIGFNGLDITINSVKNNVLNDSIKRVNLYEEAYFKSNQNNLEFSYSVPNYNKFSETEYHYQLVGNGNKWSNWSSESKVFFENLPSGEFTFNVRARIGSDISKNVATFKFFIDKRWYVSNLMIAFYILLVLLFSLFMHINYKRHYKKQQAKLLEKTQKDIELKELESKQEIMRLKNEKLQNDIDSKNKELATSTMSIIKKNEFLNTLKNELKESDTAKINKVVKIIDKNLNNTDDWKMFQEAFNNADKNFLKKIKSKHPTLTSNDLRLCAYLRLNLSSKEIAPLLNISPRSVEVKRYRLRKKINLPHNSSLTDYILEI